MKTATEARPGVNSGHVKKLRAYVTQVAADPSRADRDPVAIATWVGEDRCQVSWASGEKPIFVGGEGEPSAMKLILAALVACDVDLIANRAALLGIEIEELTVSATGHFNVRRYLGLDGADPGYERMAYTVRVRAPHATDAELTALREACERDSPVADTLRRRVGLDVTFETR